MLTCREVVELVTDALEQALPAPIQHDFAEHLNDCTDCLRYVAQLQFTIRALRRLADRPT